MEWKESVDNRQGYTKEEKTMMLLARETIEGINITGIITVIRLRFWIINNFSFVIFGDGAYTFSIFWSQDFFEWEALSGSTGKIFWKTEAMRWIEWKSKHAAIFGQYCCLTNNGLSCSRSCSRQYQGWQEKFNCGWESIAKKEEN